MVAKLGRPFSDKKKDTMLRVRLDKNTVEQLDYLVDKLGKSKSEIVRTLIEIWYTKEIK